MKFILLFLLTACAASLSAILSAKGWEGAASAAEIAAVAGAVWIIFEAVKEK